MSDPLTYRGHVISTEVTLVSGFEGPRYACYVTVKGSNGKSAYSFTAADVFGSPAAAEANGFTAGRLRVDEGLGQASE